MICHPRIHDCPKRQRDHYGVIAAGEVVVDIAPDGTVTGSVEDGILWLEKALTMQDDDVLRCTLAYMRAIHKAKE